MSQKLRFCRVDEVVIGEAAAAAVVSQQVGGDDTRRGIGCQTVREVGLAAVAAAVFEGERAGVERQRVELQ